MLKLGLDWNRLGFMSGDLPARGERVLEVLLDTDAEDERMEEAAVERRSQNSMSGVAEREALGLGNFDGLERDSLMDLF